MTFKGWYIWIDGTGSRRPSFVRKTLVEVIAGTPADAGRAADLGLDEVLHQPGRGPRPRSAISSSPVAVYPDPIRGGRRYVLVMCGVSRRRRDAARGSNARAALARVEEEFGAQEPIFGIEQECTFFEGERARSASRSTLPRRAGRLLLRRRHRRRS